MKKFYITTSIPYVNAFPHIGFALESIQADVLARYHTSLKEDVFFLTGTDEHGAKIAKAAKEAGKDVLEFAGINSLKYKELKELLNLSNNDFIRTTDEERHVSIVKEIWKKLEQNGDLYKKKYSGLYCQGCEAFLTKKDLIDGKCLIHQKEPEIIEEENYFFRLTKYLPKIKSLIEKDSFKIIPQTRKNEIIGMINQGIEDVSFSREKEKYWGIEVPGDPSQSMYVWPDALSNYISAIRYLSDKKRFNKYWPADIHCIGKDIAKFHCLFWPAMLLSLGIKLPKIIFVHGFITVSGQKMSKSLGNVIDPFELVKKYGQDPVRYYLLREIPSAEDGDFTYEKFEQRYNADLANGIGNLLSRTLKLVEIVGDYNKAVGFKKETLLAKKLCKKHLDDFRFNDALKAIWDLISFFDKKINQERPWETKDKKLIYNILKGLEEIALLLKPFLPETSERILKQIKTKKSEPLFKRI